MILLFLALGVILGIIAGMIPGLHSNNISKIAFLMPLFGIEGLALIISMAIVQSFVDFIPSIYFGAPDADTYEGILPGHILFLEGKAHEAIILTVFGGVIAIIISLIIMIFFIQFIQININNFSLIIPPILIISIILLIFSENKSQKKIIAGFVLFASATQGFLFPNQIFALITGYFGIATLIKSKKEKEIKQKNEEINVNGFIEGIQGVIGGAIVSIIPGIGNNLAAAIIKLFKTKNLKKNYLVLLGSINTSNFIFSLPVLFFLQKARNGVMIFIKEESILTEGIFLNALIFILISGGIGALTTILISKKMSNCKINFGKIEKITILFLILLVVFFNGIIGLIALFFSTSLGLIAINTKVKRSNCLGFLIVPVLFFYVFVLI